MLYNDYTSNPIPTSVLLSQYHSIAHRMISGITKDVGMRFFCVVIV